MRIGIVTLVTPAQKRGIGNYVVNLIDALQEVDSENEYFIFIGQDTCGLFDIWADNFHPVVLRLTHDPRWLMRPLFYLWQNSLIALSLRARRIDVLHLPNLLPLVVRFVPTVVTIPDLSEYSVEKYHSVRQFYRKRLPHLLVHTSNRIITISENSKHELVTKTGIRADKVEVTYLASGLHRSGSADKRCDRRLLRERYGVEFPYILYVGSWYPHKNIPRLLSAFAKLKKESGIPHSLVLVGRNSPGLSSLLARARDLSIASEIVVTGYVPDDHLACLYEEAELFVFPSISEGFGLPILEAMSYETPVITSNVSSLAEVAGDAALTIDPLDTHALADAMLSVLTDNRLKESLVVRGRERAGQFSWIACAERTVDVYKRTLADTSAGPRW